MFLLCVRNVLLPLRLHRAQDLFSSILTAQLARKAVRAESGLVRDVDPQDMQRAVVRSLHRALSRALASKSDHVPWVSGGPRGNDVCLS